MFQVEPILWLRSFESPALTWLLTAVSQAGYTPAYVALLILLIFGLRLRPGFSVLAALLLAGIATDGLKKVFELPRPTYVDTRLSLPGLEIPSSVGHGSPSGFWKLFDPRTLAEFRSRPSDSYGLPSGHVGMATAFVLAAAVFFRSRAALLLAAGWIPLMAVSRMYLARHYLADVLAGFVVGVLVLASTVLLLRPLARDRPSVRGLWPLAALALLLLTLTPFVALLHAENVGRLAGLVLAYALVLTVGVPPDGAPLGTRAARVATAVFLYVAADLLIGGVWDAAGWEDTRTGAAVATLLVTAATLAGTFEICRRLGWYAEGVPRGRVGA